MAFFRPDERTRAKRQASRDCPYKKEYNKATGCFLMCPLTTKRKGYMTEVLCEIDDKIAVILSDQIRCVDFTLRKAEYIATISTEILSEVKAKIHALIF